MPDNCSKGCENNNSKESNSCDIPDSGFVSLFKVTKMDCPSEERLIRMAIENIPSVKALDFDIPNRDLKVYHEGEIENIKEKLMSLNFGTTLISTQNIDDQSLSEAMDIADAENSKQSKVLIWLLAINATMFVIEFIVGIIAQSTGLIADSLDMFADAAVYGLALYAVGRSDQLKLKAAHLSGWFQILLALGALSEVVRRFIFGSEPVSSLMMAMGLVALVANVACLALISGKKESGAHMKASWIFSANDVIANTGIIIAGALVAYTGSPYPDLLIGLIIAVLVLNGARRILNIKS